MGACASSLDDELRRSKNVALYSSSMTPSFTNGQHSVQCPAMYGAHFDSNPNQHQHHHHQQQQQSSSPQTVSKCCVCRQTCPACQIGALSTASCLRPLELLLAQQIIQQQLYSCHQTLPTTLQPVHHPIRVLSPDMNCSPLSDVLTTNYNMETLDHNHALINGKNKQNGKHRDVSIEVSVERSARALKLFKDVLGKYSYMRNLQDLNENEFYSFIDKYPELTFPVVYTPGVGLACQNFSYLVHNPRGLFFNIEEDKGRILERLQAHSQKNVRAIVVTDGERILGLGDLGYNGMGIPIGKMALYTAIAHIPPAVCLPVTLDVGTNNKTYLADPGYKGLRRARVTGPEYDAFVEEFMTAVVKVYGKSCLIQFEDFGNKNAFKLLSKYEKNYLTFNDDIQGTASVAVAGILASLRITNKKISDNKFVFFGAGEAALGIAKLICMAMMKEGVTEQEAKDRIFLVDSKGLVSKGRPVPVDPHKEEYVKNLPHIKELHEVIEAVKPTALIGASAVGGAFNQTVLTKMGQINERPIIFALSNPTDKAECTAEQAIRATQNRCIFASGSPFDPVEYEGKLVKVGQGNNAYIFPGVAFAALMCQTTRIPNEAFLAAAESLAAFVNYEEIKSGLVYPQIENIFKASFQVSVDVADYFIKNNIPSIRPLANKADAISLFKQALYLPEDDPPPELVPSVWLASKH